MMIGIGIPTSQSNAPFMIFLLLYLLFNVLEAKSFHPSHEGCENDESQHYTSEAEGEDIAYALTADALANSNGFRRTRFGLGRIF